MLHGRVETHAPASALGWLLALCLGTPRTDSDGAIRFELRASATEEAWTRHFPSRSMRSRFRLAHGHIVEVLGPARLTFALTTHDDRLEMTLLRLHFFGVSCPAWLMPRVLAEESGAGARLHFRVRAEVPLAGLVASYHGYLLLTSGAAP